MYRNVSNSPYIFLMDECLECEPVTTADFNWTPLIPNPGVPASFTGTADGTQPEFDWTFGDATTGTGQVITHTYAAANTYTVIMTASTCDAANTVVATHDVMVVEGSLAVITPTSLEATLCPEGQTPAEINVCNQGSQPLTWSLEEQLPLGWLSETPLSGTVAAGLCEVVSVTFDSTGLSAGVYTGTLEFTTNDVLHLEVPVDVTLNVAGPPTNASFTFSPATPIVGELVDFTGTADSSHRFIYWDFGMALSVWNYHHACLCQLW
jgi:PKD repeat protein